MDVNSALATLRKRRSVPPHVRRAFKWVLLAVGALVVLAAVVASIQDAAALRRARKMTWAGPTPPASMVVCRVSATEPCAQAAATRIGLPVAWMPAPSGYRLRWLAAGPGTMVPPGRRIAFESLASGQVDLSLDTQPAGPWEAGNERLVGTYRENGNTVMAYRDLYGYGPDQPEPTTLTLRWLHAGVQYSLFVIPHYMLERLDLNPARFAALIARVRYAVPH